MKNKDPLTRNNGEKGHFEFVAHVAAQSVCGEHGKKIAFEFRYYSEEAFTSFLPTPVKSLIGLWLSNSKLIQQPFSDLGNQFSLGTAAPSQ